MSTQDDEFMATLRATFQAEAEELLQNISSMLLELEKLPLASPLSAPAAAIIESVYREAHTLKGASRAVDFQDIETICQRLEDIFSSWKRHTSIPTPEAFDSLHQAIDIIRGKVAPPASQTSNGKNQDEALIKRLGTLRASTPASPGGGAASASNVAPITPAPPATAAAPPAEPERVAAPETVRISIDKLDSRLMQAEDMLVLKTITAQRARELSDMTRHLQQWQREWSKVSSEARGLRQSAERAGKGDATLKGLVNFLDWNCEFQKLLEGKLLALADQAQQDHHDVAKRVDDLLEGSKKLLMLPFSALANQLPRVVRDLCREQQKEAEFVIGGGEVEIDKRILEEMKDALIHILRNCVDHGVETPAQRAQFHKPAKATITVAASPINGSKVEILISDDGAGINLARVKESAVSHGIITEADARTLDASDAMRLIFRSEVTTSPTVTTLSGRGLGMAIVHGKTEKLGGRILVDSKAGAGTTLRIVLPLTLSTFRGILVSVGDRIFVMPTTQVERIVRVKPADISTVENREAIAVQGKAVSLVRLVSVLDLPAGDSAAGDAAPMPAVIVHTADKRIAFVVDEILREEEVLVKPLRKPLVRVPNIAGATVLGNGKVALVLNIMDLMKTARSGGAVPSPVAGPGITRKAPKKKVLVVEDSITSRMFLKGTLESAGYQVKTAVDGVDAFTALREDEFDLVVSDVEMPRMNGFDLTARIRADQRLGELPVVLITALESNDQRERGIDAGASAYVVKSSFDQQNLLEVIHRLT